MFDQITIVVPVYNNAETLRSLVAQVTKAVEAVTRDVYFVFVEDASQDRSAQVLQEMARSHIQVIQNARNLGQQESIRKGLAASKGQAVVVMDADLQDPPQAIPSLLSALADGRYDAAFATRIGSYQSDWRMFTSRVFRFLIRRLTNLPSGAGGFVAITTDVAHSLAQRTSSRFYLAGMIGCGGYQILGQPVRRNLRQTGQSGYSNPMRFSLGVSNLYVVLLERIFCDQR